MAHISIRVTHQRRANLDALAEIAHTDGDTATIDFALSYTLSALARKESTMNWIEDAEYAPNQPRIDMAERQRHANMTTEQRARERVSNDPSLRQYEDVIFYDWPNWGEHLTWIVVGPVAEIVDWAEAIEAQEEIDPEDY